MVTRSRSQIPPLRNSEGSTPTANIVNLWNLVKSLEIAGILALMMQVSKNNRPHREVFQDR